MHPLILLFLPILASGAFTSSTTRFQKRVDRAINSSSKAGLGWPNGNADDYKQYTTTGKVSWYYTWSPYPTGIDSDLEFVPMLWGSDQVDAFQSTINNTISAGNTKAVLGFNEPQQTGQSNLSPEDGASLWKTYIEPLKSQGIRLGTPAPSSAPSGKTWLQEWLSVCAGGCNPDFVALHYYDINATDFQLYLQDMHDTFQLPLWVTEWADNNFNGGNQPGPADVVSFLNQTQSFMDSTDWVERYAWFGVMRDLQGIDTDNAMMNSNGKITSLGEQYIGAISADQNTDGNGGFPSVDSGSVRHSNKHLFAELCIATTLMTLIL